MRGHRECAGAREQWSQSGFLSYEQTFQVDEYHAGTKVADAQLAVQQLR